MRKYDKTMECILALTPSFSELWKDKINPERSLLYEVVKVAEVLEIVHLVGSWIGHQFGKGNDIPGGSKKFSNNPPCAMDGEGKDETNLSSTNDQQQSKKQNYQHQGSLDKKLKGGKHLTNKFQLSKEGHDMLLHINCALSTKAGHFANTCPERWTASGGDSSKPPRMASFSIHIDTDVKNCVS